MEKLLRLFRDPDGQTDAFQLYIVLAKVPALLCRLGHVPYDRAFGALMGGCAPYNRTFGALIVRSLSITKNVSIKTKILFTGDRT